MICSEVVITEREAQSFVAVHSISLYDSVAFQRQAVKFINARLAAVLMMLVKADFGLGDSLMWKPHA